MEDYIRIAHELELVVIPLSANSKKPFLPNWQKWTLQKSKDFFSKPRSGVNLGIVCGEESNITVIDVEADQLDAWNDFVDKRSLETLTIHTGGGGKHFYFNYFTPNNRIKAKLPNKGTFDVKTTNGQVVWVGSTHPNGKKYHLISDTTEIIDAPEWITALL